jgi:hypothetical protein
MHANNIFNSTKKINALRGEYRLFFSIGVGKIFPISGMKSLIYQYSFWIGNRSFEFVWEFFFRKNIFNFSIKGKIAQIYWAIFYSNRIRERMTLCINWSS